MVTTVHAGTQLKKGDLDAFLKGSVSLSVRKT
jgi:hypothetical protein